MSEEPIRRLVERLADGDDGVRERTLHTLVLMGPAAVPALLALLEGALRQFQAIQGAT